MQYLRKILQWARPLPFNIFTNKLWFTLDVPCHCLGPSHEQPTEKWPSDWYYVHQWWGMDPSTAPPLSRCIGRYHKRRPARGLVSRFKAEGPRLKFDSASAVLFHQKGCGLWTQSCCDFVPHNWWNNNMALIAAHLMQESFWWWQCSDRYILSLFTHLHTPSPFSPSLISLMVSVEVKHHVYQRASIRQATDLLRSLQSRYHVTFLSCLTVRDYLNYNRGMDTKFRCFLDDIKVVEPSEEVDATDDAKGVSSLIWTLLKTENHRKSDTTRCLPKNDSRGRLTP